MTKMTATLSRSQEDIEAENTLAQITTELRQISESMREKQIEIDRLKAESEIIATHTDAVLARLRVQIAALEAPR